MAADFDYILVGGGLQSGLIALALRANRPQTCIALIERAARLGGNHTWCFHADDLSTEARSWVAPLVEYSWPGYDVVFPHLRRHIAREYSAVTSDRLHEVVSSRVEGQVGSALFLRLSATRVGTRDVVLEDGRTLSSKIVIDARGPRRNTATKTSGGYQKFVGLELELARPHGLNQPVVMDSTVDQSDGYRFFYTLPFTRDRILLEDTYFHESPILERDLARKEIHRYADTKGYDVKRVVREEFGVLPMPWGGSLPRDESGPLVAGYRGGWFHPATGYSFPIAARLADFIADRAPEELAVRRFRALMLEHTRQARYCHILNSFLFLWYAPTNRWNIFQRFYRLPLDTIGRFYALRMTIKDRFRLLVGRPPRGLSLRYRMRRRSNK
ncbi:MAG: lycopene beta-cyclase CrtY [Candidatus Latescibacterota bacterium]|nr:MAG: lycopene beta-cyclase CrtY [Candidatus Latescibacterota bacterium]